MSTPPVLGRGHGGLPQGVLGWHELLLQTRWPFCLRWNLRRTRMSTSTGVVGGFLSILRACICTCYVHIVRPLVVVRSRLEKHLLFGTIAYTTCIAVLLRTRRDKRIGWMRNKPDCPPNEHLTQRLGNIKTLHPSKVRRSCQPTKGVPVPS
ncbi:hypothetical protein B0T26DRAFT_204658 [Lasiosphaeria miniovina]|uniref:Transmembrane protein n=1 Tax=Lasiosphaeria miniovina TaxID=1954250 RepID=A0AA40E2W1_9PEZI|nr:uncharacterized protein B0T26DRAFT_204658 [Lasiosphaeria miniovina]KAK0722151.1 hypothetical protein B0T26DRAFT_204658 [Lasiosphaeria miniovina]